MSRSRSRTWRLAALLLGTSGAAAAPIQRPSTPPRGSRPALLDELLEGRAPQPHGLPAERLRGGQMAMQSAPVEEVHEVRFELEDEPDTPPPPPKQLVHQLEVEEAVGLDASFCALNPAKMEELGMMAGDNVRIKGKRDRETLCVLQEDSQVPEASIWLTTDARSNLGVTPGDPIKVYSCDAVKPGERVELAPFGDAMAGLEPEELLEKVVRPYFSGKGDLFLPVCVNNRIRIQHGAQRVELKVVAADALNPRTPKDQERCLVTPETALELSPDPLDRAAEAAEEDFGSGYEEIGGCDKQLSKIRELVELPMRHPKVFTSVGVRPPRGVLIHGPPGCGKTMIAKAVAAETGAYFIMINGAEFMSTMAGESEQNLR